MFDLESTLKMLPTDSGVYIMKNADGVIIYIGKAKNLKNRVKQYFNSSKKTEKVRAMVSHIASLEYIVTPSETNALVLENNLIKQHKPFYNILLKDDKQYPYIKIDFKDAYPRLEVVRNLGDTNSRYFGPYMQGISAYEVVKIVNTVFALRTCKHNLEKLPASHRPCLNFHIGQCSAPCKNKISKEEYRQKINNAIAFLGGNDSQAIGEVTTKMMAASEREDYETALFYKERLETLKNIERKQIAALPRDINADFFAIIDSGVVVSAAVIIVRGGKLIGGDTFTLDTIGLSESELLSDFLIAYYEKNPMLASEIVISIEPDELGALHEYLEEKYKASFSIILAKKGVKKELVDMAYANALNNLQKCHKVMERKENMTIKALEQLSQYIGIKNIKRMECYDNSNISGTNPVSSMVVFTDGVPNKKHYRHFRVKYTEGINDFQTMYEVLVRRLERYKEGKDLSFKTAPDLIIVDGGKGQLKYAIKAMDDTGVHFNLLALAKREELLYAPGVEEPIVMAKNGLAYTLVQRLRDEAHRFAITYHRSLREKRLTESELLSIEGIGKSKTKKLFLALKSIGKIKSADIDELKSVEGISERDAQNIYRYFHNEQKDEKL